MGSKALAVWRRCISDPFIFKTCPYDIGPSKLLSRLVCVCVCIFVECVRAFVCMWVLRKYSFSILFSMYVCIKRVSVCLVLLLCFRHGALRASFAVDTSEGDPTVQHNSI